MLSSILLPLLPSFPFLPLPEAAGSSYLLFVSSSVSVIFSSFSRNSTNSSPISYHLQEI
ncbi:hypothetical protein Hanom_Chr08g00758481 [Helianthus anomalus]